MYRIAPQTSHISRLRLALTNPGPQVLGPQGLANSLDRELVRKSIHLLVALVPPLAAVHLIMAIGFLMAGILFYTAAEAMRLAGIRVALVSGLTVVAARPADTGFVLGPVTLGLGAMLALLLYPLPASAIAIYALAFGDAAASVIGMTFSGWRMPLKWKKTVAGSLACFTVVFLVTFTLTVSLPLSVAVAAAAMTIEALSGRDLDNLLIPVGVGFVVQAAKVQF